MADTMCATLDENERLSLSIGICRPGRWTDLPVHRKSTGAHNHQLQKVAERWRLHRPVRSTFPAYDVTRQLTYFRRVAELQAFRGDESWRVWFRHGHTSSSAFHYLYTCINIVVPGTRYGVKPVSYTHLTLPTKRIV